MTTDVLYISYRNDREWLRWSTATLEKHLTGHRRVIIVTPEQDVPLFEEIARERKHTLVKGVPDWPGQGYIWQQHEKLCADIHTDADLILHVDSDVFFTAPTSVEDFMLDGKPAWMWSPYRPDRNDIVWKAPTERALGSPVDREFMQAQPLLVRRELYRLCRDHIRKIHDIPCNQFFRDRGAEWQRTKAPVFSEFNFMGAVAWAIASDDYRWVDRDNEPWPAAYHKCRQFWSHSPIEDCMGAIQSMLHGNTDSAIHTTNRGIWVINDDTHISRWVEQQARLDFDVPLLNRLCQHIRPGDTVVDVGAFIGDHTLAYANATHGVDSGRVLAFEPNPTAFECLRRNMAGRSHVECHNLGLGAKSGEMAVSPSPNAGASHLTKGKGVKIRTLDSFKLDRLDFLKIDAEGMEVKILEGARETIERHHPTMFIEVNAGALERAGTSETDLLSRIAELGYEVHGAELGSPQCDILCTHPDRKAKLKPLVCALGVCHKDVHLAELWLKWVAHLASLPGGDSSEFELLVMQTQRVSLEQHAALRNAVAEAPGMFKVHFATCPDEWEVGYPGSASHLFLRTLEWVEQHRPGHATLWCETDTVATCPGWFRQIALEYTASPMPFMGARVNPHNQHAHMTGNGVYPPNWRELAPRIATAHNAPGTAFWGKERGQPWDVWAETEIEPKMHECRSIQQIWRPTVFSAANLHLVRGDCALFHQCKDGSLILALTAARYPGFAAKLPPVTHAYLLETGAKSVEVAGRTIDFMPVARGPGGKLLCARLPADIAEQWLLDSAVGRQGVDRIPVEDYHRLRENRHAYRLD